MLGNIANKIIKLTWETVDSISFIRLCCRLQYMQVINFYRNIISLDINTR